MRSCLRLERFQVSSFRFRICRGDWLIVQSIEKTRSIVSLSEGGNQCFLMKSCSSLTGMRSCLRLEKFKVSSFRFRRDL